MRNTTLFYIVCNEKVPFYYFKLVLCREIKKNVKYKVQMVEILKFVVQNAQ